MNKTELQKWINQNTAILVIHGIGNQRPLETLDQFGRTLIESFSKDFSGFNIAHKVAQKPRSGNGFWYDNYIRIQNKDSEYHLDIYEYYWANLTQDLTKTEDIDYWIRGVVKGAKKFYKRNLRLLEIEEKSFFKKGGRVSLFRYWLLLKIAGRIIPITQRVIRFLLFLLSKIPFLSWLIQPALDWLNKIMKRNLESIIGDIIVYNSLDAKSKFFEVRKSIMDGAVSSLQYLIEPDEQKPDQFRYKRVIIAGHSLGSQISFDAINRLTHHICQGNVRGYDSQGNIKKKMQISDSNLTSVDDILSGLITFGSPLDKIAFFLWEQAEKNQYLFAQILRNYHCFKQRSELFNSDGYLIDKSKTGNVVYPELDTPFQPIFDDILWYNFYDRRDYVSGSLDFYNIPREHNINCDFEGGFFQFSHSKYWLEKKMFEKVINDILLPKNPPKIIN